MQFKNIMEYPRGERLLLLFQRLPRGKENAKSLQELMQEYNPTGYKASSRRKSLENDLRDLNLLLGEDSVQRSPPFDFEDEKDIKGITAKYYINPDFVLANFDNESLFFWEMLNKFTANYLPISTQQSLERKLNSVRKQYYSDYQKTDLAQWKNHLITLPSILQAPKYNSDVLATIQQAIKEQKRLKVQYRSKWQNKTNTFPIYPVGLVFQDNMIYLTGFFDVKETIKTTEEHYLEKHCNLALIRILDAQITDKAIPSWVNSFKLEDLRDKGLLEKHLTDRGEPINLKLKINKNAAEHLTERPLTNQKVEDLDDKNLLITAKVMNTLRLLDWLVSMSQYAEVLEPAELRESVIERLQKALALYQIDDKTK